MAINTEITRIAGAKADIKTAIEAKGVSVPSNALISDYSTKVAEIPDTRDYLQGTSGIKVIPNGTTSLRPYAYYYYPSAFSLSSQDFPSTLTSIGDKAFSYANLSSFYVPSRVTLGSHVFNNSSATSGYFEVTTIPQYTCCGCTSLVSVGFGSGVTTIGDYAFSQCSSLTTLNFEGTPTLTTIRYRAFTQCSSLTSVSLPSTVTSIEGSAFQYCSSLTSINIPEGVTSIELLTFNGTALPSVTLPSGVTSIGDKAFKNCTSLTMVTCKATTPPTLGTDVFVGCTNLAHIYVPAASVNDYKAASVWSDYASIIEADPLIYDFDFEADAMSMAANTNKDLPYDNTTTRTITIDGTQYSVYDCTGDYVGLSRRIGTNTVMYISNKDGYQGLVNGSTGTRPLIIDNLQAGDVVTIRTDTSQIDSVGNLTLSTTSATENVYMVTSNGAVVLNVIRSRDANYDIKELKVVRP